MYTCCMYIMLCLVCAVCLVSCAGCVRSESSGARLEGQCGVVRENLTELVVAEQASQAQPGDPHLLLELLNTASFFIPVRAVCVHVCMYVLT